VAYTPSPEAVIIVINGQYVTRDLSLMEREILGSTTCDDAIAATQFVLVELLERGTPMG